MDIATFVRRALPAFAADALRRGERSRSTKSAIPNCNDRRAERFYRLRQLIDGYAQRRHQHDNIPDRPGQESVLSSLDTDLCGKPWFALIQLNSRNKPALADSYDARNLPQAGEFLRQMLDFRL